MPFMFAYATCWVCELPFGFNPERVPSYQGEPVCEDCMTVVNKAREARGLVPHRVPPDAYKPAEVA